MRSQTELRAELAHVMYDLRLVAASVFEAHDMALARTLTALDALLAHRLAYLDYGRHVGHMEYVKDRFKSFIESFPTHGRIVDMINNRPDASVYDDGRDFLSLDKFRDYLTNLLEGSDYGEFPAHVIEGMFESVVKPAFNPNVLVDAPVPSMDYYKEHSEFWESLTHGSIAENWAELQDMANTLSEFEQPIEELLKALRDYESALEAIGEAANLRKKVLDNRSNIIRAKSVLAYTVNHIYSELDVSPVYDLWGNLRSLRRYLYEMDDAAQFSVGAFTDAEEYIWSVVDKLNAALGNHQTQEVSHNFGELESAFYHMLECSKNITTDVLITGTNSKLALRKANFSHKSSNNYAFVDALVDDCVRFIDAHPDAPSTHNIGEAVALSAKAFTYQTMANLDLHYGRLVGNLLSDVTHYSGNVNRVDGVLDDHTVTHAFEDVIKHLNYGRVDKIDRSCVIVGASLGRECNVRTKKLRDVTDRLIDLMDHQV